jgi:hypothetical protein
VADGLGAAGLEVASAAREVGLIAALEHLAQGAVGLVKVIRLNHLCAIVRAVALAEYYCR